MADLASIEMMRQDYAENHLESLASTVKEYARKNVWAQLLGVGGFEPRRPRHTC